MKKPILIITLILLFLTFPLQTFASYRSGFNRPVSEMTSYEKMSELRVANEIVQKDGFYPQERITELTNGLADDQIQVLEKYEQKLNRDLKRIEEYEARKKNILATLKKQAKKEGEAHWETEKKNIYKKAENSARKALNISELEWDEFKNVVEQGKEAYEREVKSYVDDIKTVYNAINAYRESADKHKYVSDEAQGLLGTLGAMGTVLSAGADKIEKTKVGRPVAEILKFYAEATKLGDTAAEVAFEAIHRDNTLSDYHETQLSDAFKEYNKDNPAVDKGGASVTFKKSPLMLRDENFIILQSDASNEYVVIDVDVEKRMWPFRDIRNYSYATKLSEDEYKKLEMLYSGYQNALKNPAAGTKNIKDKLENLTAKQLVKLSRGEDIDVVTREAGWIRSEAEEKLTYEQLKSAIDASFSRQQSNHSIDSVYETLYGDPKEDDEAGGVLDRVRSLWGNDARSNRMEEIRDTFSIYMDNLTSDEYFEGNTNHHWEKFRDLIQNYIEQGKDLKQLKDNLQSLNENATQADVAPENIRVVDAFSESDLLDSFLGTFVSFGDVADEIIRQLEQFIDSVEFYPVRGKVMDSESGEPISGANVTVFRSTGASSLVIQTDSNGNFSLGKYVIGEPLTVTASAEGYFSSKRGGSLKNSDTVVNISLKKDEEEEEDKEIRNSIVLLIDVSGSMGGSKIANAITSAQNTVNRMGRSDEVAILTFSGCGSTSVRVPFTRTTSNNKSFIFETISTLRAGGRTAIAEATAYAGNYMRSNAKGSSMNLILLSDGEETCGGNPVESARGLN